MVVSGCNTEGFQLFLKAMAKENPPEECRQVLILNNASWQRAMALDGTTSRHSTSRHTARISIPPRVSRLRVLHRLVLQTQRRTREAHFSRIHALYRQAICRLHTVSSIRKLLRDTLSSLLKKKAARRLSSTDSSLEPLFQFSSRESVGCFKLKA